MKRKRPALRAHQERALSYCLKNEYTIMGLDPRLGKSRVAIETKEKTGLNCLVVCPSYLVENWEIEIKKWVDRPIVTPFYKGKDLFEVVDSDYVVVGYSLVQKAPWLFEWADMVVLDEAPAVKSMSAKRTQFIHKEVYENSIKRLLLLTGTPLKNRVKEFYSLLALTFYNPNRGRPSFLKKYPDEISFADQFSDRKQFRMELPDGRRIPVVKWTGLRHRKELKKWLKGRYIRIRDTDVEDMPEVSYKDVLISKTEDPRLLAEFNRHFDRDEDAGSTRSEYKAQAALKKVPFTEKYVRDLLEAKRCCLIYTDHIISAQALAQRFEVPAITGKMVAKKRGKIADRFQAGEGRILVATIQSLKEGKPLHRSNDLVFNDLGWIPGDNTQVINRIRAIGKKKPNTVHRIFGSPQDEKISDSLEEKIDTIDRAT